MCWEERPLRFCSLFWISLFCFFPALLLCERAFDVYATKSHLSFCFCCPILASSLVVENVSGQKDATELAKNFMPPSSWSAQALASYGRHHLDPSYLRLRQSHRILRTTPSFIHPLDTRTCQLLLHQAFWFFCCAPSSGRSGQFSWEFCAVVFWFRLVVESFFLSHVFL